MLTGAQEERFERAVEQLKATRLKPAWVHAGNSSTVDNPAPPPGWLVGLAASVGALAMVRSGWPCSGIACR